jgi:cytochrome c oxidase subunit 2
MSAWRISALALVAAGCAGPPAALEPGGPAAARIESLWWLFAAMSVAVMVLVLLALAGAVVSGRRRERQHTGDGAPPDDPRAERRTAVVVAVATGVTALAILALLAVSVLTGRALARLATPDALSIELVGHQWWWEVTYPDPEPARQVKTANEIHVPVGRAVRISLSSQDVIHSFWVPALHGKRDLIPGHRNAIWIQADRPGTYEGQCAEFCGLQHARMRLSVIADEPAQFTAWLEGQRAPAREPATDVERHGRDAFVAGPCALCHTVQGTDARGTVAPDLTHLGSRTTIAAGTLVNTPGHLAGWIVDPQSAKPGAQMPASSLDVESLQAILAWLQSLK